AAGEEIGRMRLEGEQRAGLAQPFGKRLGAGDHASMAAMQAVEIADRHHGSLEPRRRDERIAGDDERMRGAGQECVQMSSASLKRGIDAGLQFGSRAGASLETRRWFRALEPSGTTRWGAL